MSWSWFKTAFPGALVLSRDTGFSRRYGINPYPGYDNAGARPFLFDGDIDERLEAKQRVITVRTATDLVIVTEELRNVGVAVFKHDGVELVAFLVPGTASALDGQLVAEGKDVGASGVFVNNVDGETLDLSLGAGGVLTDLSTGSTFDVFGRGLSGAYDGTDLTLVEHLDTFWFAIAAFSPDVESLA